MLTLIRFTIIALSRTKNTLDLLPVMVSDNAYKLHTSVPEDRFIRLPADQCEPDLRNRESGYQVLN